MAAIAATEIDIGPRKLKVFYRPQTSDETIIRDIFSGRAYDLGRLQRAREIAAYFEKKILSGKSALVVDCGANIGMASLYFSLLLGKARVVAVESSPETFKVLEKNAAGHDIRTVHAAISATRGLAEAIDPEISGGFLGHRVAEVGKGPAGKRLGLVPRVTVNDIYEEEAARTFPFIVKVDIEGGEADLFSANTEWVEKTPIVVVELHDWMLPKQGIAAPFLKCIAGMDRDFVPIGENIFSISNRLV